MFDKNRLKKDPCLYEECGWLFCTAKQCQGCEEHLIEHPQPAKEPTEEKHQWGDENPFRGPEKEKCKKCVADWESDAAEKPCPGKDISLVTEMEKLFAKAGVKDQTLLRGVMDLSDRWMRERVRKTREFFTKPTKEPECKGVSGTDEYCDWDMRKKRGVVHASCPRHGAMRQPVGEPEWTEMHGYVTTKSGKHYPACDCAGEKECPSYDIRPREPEKKCTPEARCWTFPSKEFCSEHRDSEIPTPGYSKDNDGNVEIIEDSECTCPEHHFPYCPQYQCPWVKGCPEKDCPTHKEK